MPPISLDEVGIKQFTSPPTLLAESEVEAVLEESEPVLEYDGGLHDTAGHAFGLKNEIKLKGKGDLPVALALASDGAIDHEDISGGVTIITRVKEGQYADKHNDWEADATNCPDAAAAASSSGA